MQFSAGVLYVFVLNVFVYYIIGILSETNRNYQVQRLMNISPFFLDVT